MNLVTFYKVYKILGRSSEDIFVNIVVLNQVMTFLGGIFNANISLQAVVLQEL